MTEFLATHRALLHRLLDGDDLDALTVRHGQFHHVVIGSGRVVCFARTKAAAARLPDRAAPLRELAGLELGFRTPEPLFDSGSTGTDQPSFLVLSRVPGAPLETDVLQDPETAEVVAAQYATLLAGLARAGTTTHAQLALPHASPDRIPRDLPVGRRAHSRLRRRASPQGAHRNPVSSTS